MSPAQIASTKRLADLVRFMRWNLIDGVTAPNDITQDGIVQIDDEVSFEGLPVECRTLIESVPALVAKIERLERSIALAILDGA